MSESGTMEAFLKESIPSIPDFPIRGIDFKDITPLLAHPDKFPLVVNELSRLLSGVRVHGLVAIESRGFVIGAPLAANLNAGLVLARKPGKLPGARDSFPYTCEYSTGQLEVRRDAIVHGRRYLVVDDLLATGGTARATADYVASKGGQICGFAFLVELTMLRGRDRLAEGPVFSLLRY